MTALVPTSTIVMFVVALILTTAVPFFALLILCLKKKINWLPMLLGAAAFFVSQILIRIPIINVLSTQSWYIDFAGNFYWIFVIALSFSAGLFEESARLGGASILKGKTAYKDAISFGLGHGICEVIMINGMSNINNVIYSIIINIGQGDLLGDNAAYLTYTLTTATTPMILVGLYERIPAMIFHVFATLLVFKGVNEKKISYYFYAILAHTIFNAAAVFLTRYIGVFAGEAALGVFAAIMLVVIIKCKPFFRRKDELLQEPAEINVV